MKVENLKFIKLSLIIMSLLFMFSFASVTCFAQDSSDQKAPPSVTVQRNDPTGDFAVLPSDNVESWVGSITSVMVSRRMLFLPVSRKVRGGIPGECSRRPV